MYEHILVPIDGSGQAAKGLHEAIKLAISHQGHIRLVHVLNRAPLASADLSGSRFDVLFERLREDGQQLLARAEDCVRKAGVPVDAKLVDATGGDPGEFIAQEASTWPADVIVCGTHGRHGLMRAIMGSEAEEIVRQSPVPVLMVPGCAALDAATVR